MGLYHKTTDLLHAISKSCRKYNDEIREMVSELKKNNDLSYTEIAKKVTEKYGLNPPMHKSFVSRNG